MKTVLLLGSTGQLGSLIHASTPDSVKLASLDHTQLDITWTDFLASKVDELQPDIVINCAAYTAVDKAEEERELAFRVNSEAVAGLAKMLPESTRLIHLSTDFVFSRMASHPYRPDADTEPVSVYGRSKLEGEEAIRRIHGNNSVILRTSWLYSGRGKNFVNTMLRLMKAGQPLKVVNDQYGSPTSAKTLADVVWRFVDSEVRGVFHWSDSGVITWYEFAVEIFKYAREIGLLDRDVSITPVPASEYITAAKRPAYSALDCTSTETALGIRTRPWKDQLHLVLGEIKQVGI